MNGKQLKNSILQWAIQGKLVPQDPNDEPASVLLERIREEKARLVKEKKIKKDKNESIIFRGDDNSHYEKFADGTIKCIDDEIPFEIPQSWCWTRMSSVLDVRDGTHDTPSYVSSGYPLITGKDFYNGYFDLSKTQYISTTDYEVICQRSKVDVGDIIFSMIGGNIGSQILITEDNYFEMAIKNVALFKHYEKGMINELYLSYFLQSRVVDFKSIASGGAQSFVSLKQLRNYLIPIPSYPEQLRIVSRIEDIMPIADKYEKSQDSLEKLNAEIFDKIKKSVLQEAIQGRLVPQDPNDEPTSTLLERIKAEKAKLFKEGKLKKKDLADSVIFKGEDNKYYEKIGSQVTCIDDDIPFEIPTSWAWVRLEQLCTYIQRGKSPKYSEIRKYPVVAQKCNQWTGFSLEKALFLDPATIGSYGEERFLQDGDLLWNSTGLGTLGRMAIYDSSKNEYGLAVADSHVTVIRAIPSMVSSEYLFKYFSSHTVQSVIEDKSEGSTKQKELATSTVKSYMVPLPPYEEQLRIVAAANNVIASITRR